MKPETADYLGKARATLADATKIATLPLPHVAAREAYLAVFHAAEAHIFEHTGKAAKTHRGVHSEFTRLARREPRIGRDLVTFLTDANQFKTIADYPVGSATMPISTGQAAVAISTAERFIDAAPYLILSVQYDCHLPVSGPRLGSPSFPSTIPFPNPPSVPK
jgi:uncharacterized protein (UPF0332 family)